MIKNNEAEKNERMDIESEDFNTQTEENLLKKENSNSQQPMLSKEIRNILKQQIIEYKSKELIQFLISNDIDVNSHLDFVNCNLIHRIEQPYYIIQLVLKDQILFMNY